MNRRRFFAALAVLPAAVLALGRDRISAKLVCDGGDSIQGPIRYRGVPWISDDELNNHGPMFQRALEDASIRFKPKNFSIPIRYIDQGGELTALHARAAEREKAQIIAALREDLFRG